jgi:hypothetical protein
MMRDNDAARVSPVETLENVERNHILRALNETAWVIHGKKAPRRSSASIQARCARAWKNSLSSERRDKSCRVVMTIFTKDRGCGSVA